MRVFRWSLFLLICPCVLAQSTLPSPQRDPRAVDILQRSFAAMGGTVPLDSTASGTIALVEGSTQLNGRIIIRSRGLDQSSEEIATEQGTRRIVYSRGRATETDGSALNESPTELALGSQAAAFPAVLLAAALSEPDTSFEYVGTEKTDSGIANHVRIRNTFVSKRGWQKMADFTVRDLWLDSSTALPLKVVYELRAGSGDSPRVSVEVRYFDYRVVSGIAYPHRIEKHFNGTLWATIAIEGVSFNGGLADSDFPVTEVRQ